MDSEQLKKLVKLANNNPNENEANASARKLCQILADYSFPKDNWLANWCLRHHCSKSQCHCG